MAIMTSLNSLVVFAALVTSLTAEEADCPSGFVNIANHCYMFSESILQYKPALAQCARLDAFLLTQDDDAERFTVAGYLLGRYPDVQDWRIGGFKENNSWWWSAENKIPDNNWLPNEPSNKPTLLMTKTAQGYKYGGTQEGSWYKPGEYCFPYICETDIRCGRPGLDNDTAPVPHVCPSGFVPLGQKCYKFDLQPTQGKPAIKKCKEQNSHLLALENRAEEMLISGYLQQNHFDIPTWRMGGSREKGKWYWSNGRRILCYTNWETEDIPEFPTLILVKTDCGYKWRGEHLGSPWKVPLEMAHPLICETDSITKT